MNDNNNTNDNNNDKDNNNKLFIAIKKLQGDDFW